MESAESYGMVWLVYCLATVVFYTIYWYVTGFVRSRWVCYSLRAVMLAMIITPWYANGGGNSLAPAVMVVFLDTITIGLDASGRALVPLILALILAESLASLYWFAKKRKVKLSKPSKRVQ